MENQVLLIEQMQELQELGIDTSKASMFWEIYKDGKKALFTSDLNAFSKICPHIPTFTLQDILEMLPKTIVKNYDRCYLSLSVQGDCWVSSYNCCGFEGDYSVEEQYGSTSLEAAFNMLKWCKQNNYI